jgi:hypothetical protein
LTNERWLKWAIGRYYRAVLVTTLRVAKKLRKRVFQRRGLKLIGIDAKTRIHRYDSDGWRLLG